MLLFYHHLTTFNFGPFPDCCATISLKSVLCIFCGRRFEDSFEDTQWRKVEQMQPMWLCILWGRQFGGTFEDTQCRKVKQMQPMWLCILSGMQFEKTFENTQWGKVAQMQPMWLCILSGRRFEKTFEDTQWGKVEQMQPMHYAAILNNWGNKKILNSKPFYAFNSDPKAFKPFFE